MPIAAALANMSTQRLLSLAASVLLLMVSLLALRFPVFLPDFDQWGFQINCGSGLQITLTQAGIADAAGTHFADQCHTAIAMRRAWTIPLAGAEALLLSALLIRPSHQHSANAETARATPLGAVVMVVNFLSHAARIFLIQPEFLATRHNGWRGNAS